MRIVLASSTIALACWAWLGCAAFVTDELLLPRVEGQWWQVAGNPELGVLAGPPAGQPEARQEPVDFSIWQAADGTWQIWSCIRGTNCGGYTRLFYRWEGQRLTDRDWKPMGVAMQADCPRYEVNPGGLQAPHVVLIDDVYHMFYGDWDYIGIQRSRDGKAFERWLYDNGKPGMFTHGQGCNTRDPMAIRIDDKWHVYYTAYPEKTGAVYCRMSKDLRGWSEPVTVLAGGQIGGGPCSYECPHVVAIGGYYYLFCTQSYTRPPVTSCYRSKDPLAFGVDDDRKLVCLTDVAAPEFFIHEGRHYVAALMPDIRGIRVARLAWVRDVAAEADASRFR